MESGSVPGPMCNLKDQYGFGISFRTGRYMLQYLNGIKIWSGLGLVPWSVRLWDARTNTRSRSIPGAVWWILTTLNSKAKVGLWIIQTTVWDWNQYEFCKIPELTWVRNQFQDRYGLSESSGRGLIPELVFWSSFITGKRSRYIPGPVCNWGQFPIRCQELRKVVRD